jgi:flagellar FliL protein
MAEKPEKKEAPAPADKNAPAAATVPVPPMVVPAKGGIKAWLPTLAAVVLAPLATWAVAQFVLLPRLQKSLVADDGKPVATVVPAAHAEKPPAGKSGDKKAPEPGPTYHFDNVVVNLAGTMGTRYLKTSFLVTGSDETLSTKFEAARPQLGDVTLAVLASLTLADLEEPGSKNIIREKLISAYNQALGQKLAENLYFSDFVVQ